LDMGLRLDSHWALCAARHPGREMGDDEQGVGVEGISPHQLGGHPLRQLDGGVIRGTDQLLRERPLDVHLPRPADGRGIGPLRPSAAPRPQEDPPGRRWHFKFPRPDFETSHGL